MNILNKYVQKKLITKREHPKYKELSIYNYTNECAITEAWDDLTMKCRGLIVNTKTGEIIARPFPKFFNHNQPQAPDVTLGDLSDALVMDKADGSLGILFMYNGEFHIATRGSFESDQAKWATKWFRENNITTKHTSIDSSEAPFMCDKFTHLFEIIYPENRIVLNYDFSGLVYLGSIDTGSGDYVFLDNFWNEPIREIEQYDPKNTDLLVDRENKEGYIVYYPTINNWVKYKHSEYVRLHKIISNLSEKGIWEHMKEGGTMNDLVKDLPDEFFKWVEEVWNRLFENYQSIEARVLDVMKKVKGQATRKEKAIWLSKNAKDIMSIVFSMIDEQPEKVKEQIYKKIKPKQEDE